MRTINLKSILTSLVAVLVSVNANAYDAEINGIYYNLVRKTKQATVTYRSNDQSGYSGNVTIPSTIIYEGVTYNVTTIGENAFRCSTVPSVIISEGVTTIKDHAFFGCVNLTSISIPEGVTTIGKSAFSGCRSLTSVVIPRSVTRIVDSAFESCSSLTSVNIPEGVKRIEYLTFWQCRSLTSIVIPSSVTIIENSAFPDCTGLTSVTFSEGLERIEGGAFFGCSSLTSVTIPSSVKYIDHTVFQNCLKLTTVTLNGGTDISSKSFANCPELMDVYCNSETPPTVCSDAFEGSYIDYVTLHVPADYISNYANDSFWGNSFKEIVTIDPTEYPTTIDLTDSETFDGYPSNHDMESITYTRTFSNTHWQGLYVPFTMEYSEWAAEFEIARINDIHQYDDDDNGTIDRTELEVIKVTSGSIEANTPYLIRAKKDWGEMVFTLANRTLYMAEEKSYTVSSWNTLFTFTGTYSGVTGNDMVSNAYYALGYGALRRAASRSIALSPYRWYVAITDRNGAQEGVNEVKLKVWGEDETGLTPLSVSLEEERTAVYDLSGRRITKENATKGLYIVNGKKVLK